MKQLLATSLLILIGLITIKAQEPFEHVKTLAKVAFIDVNVIDVEKERVLPHRTVYIVDGHIKTITETKDTVLPNNIFLINGKEKYLIPGLADMHVHFTGSGAFSSGTEPILFH